MIHTLMELLTDTLEINFLKYLDSLQHQSSQKGAYDFRLPYVLYPSNCIIKINK